MGASCRVTERAWAAAESSVAASNSPQRSPRHSCRFRELRLQPVGRLEWHDGSLWTEIMPAAVQQMDRSLAGAAGAVHWRMSLQFEFELHRARQSWAWQLDW